MSEYEQWLLDGDLRIAVDLLRRLARQLTRTRSFPPPPEYGFWSNDAVDDLLAAMIVKKKGLAFLLEVLGTLDTRGSVERYLLATIENFLKDQAKATQLGKLRNRLETVLGADPRFVLVSSPTRGWRLVEVADRWWQGDVDELHEAALRVRGVAIPAWNESGPTPRPARLALIAVAEAVLRQAAGIVGAQDLARVLLQRFRYAIAPETAEVLPVEDAGKVAATALDEPEQVLVGVTAQQLWNGLSTSQRSVVPYLDRPGDAAAALGIGRKEAGALVNQVIEIVRLATVNDDRADEIVTCLLEIGRPASMPAPGLARRSIYETDGRIGA